MARTPETTRIGKGWASVVLGLALVACGGGQQTVPPVAPRPALAELTDPPSGLDDLDSRGAHDLRVARSAGGDAVVVWRSAWFNREDLWANRYVGRTGTWSGPVRVEATDEDIAFDYDVSMDAAGNAVVAWSQSGAGGTSQWGTHLDAASGAWSAPVHLADAYGQLRLSGNAAGLVLAVYGAGYGRFYDPGAGGWRPEAWIAQSDGDPGLVGRAVPLTGEAGNALVVYHQSRVDWSAWLGSNEYTRASGRWQQLPPDSPYGFLGPLPLGSIFGQFLDVQLAALDGGDALAAWRAVEEGAGGSDIRLARFSGRTHGWQWGHVLLTHTPAQQFQLQRLVGDTLGRAHLLWTEVDGDRRLLKDVLLDQDGGTTCGAVRQLDNAHTGGSDGADLAVGSTGAALAVWQRSDGGRIDDGSRNNVAMSRYDPAADAWSAAVLLQNGDSIAVNPRVSTGGGAQAMVAWIQYDDGVGRVKARLLEMTATP